MKNLRRFKFVGSSQQADAYSYPRPSVGGIYDIDAQIGERTVEYWAEGCTDTIGEEWDEVTYDRVIDESQQAYCSNKNWISCKIETVIGGKSVVSEFGTNDLEEFKKFVGNLILIA